MNNTLAVTISPACRLVEYGVKKNFKDIYSLIYKDDVKLIMTALNRCSSDYTIYPELDISGRLHYHGTVHVNNMTNWKSGSIPKLRSLGFVKAKTNVNEGWQKYCTKEWESTKKILQISEPITYGKLKRGPKARLPASQPLKDKHILDYFMSKSYANLECATD